jgi:hypothetical protein
MSCLHYTSGLEQSYHGTTCRSARPRAGWSSSTLATLRSIFDGLHESFVAYRAYERLRARGLPHDAAIRDALGVGREPAPMPREAVWALCFAGNA